MMIPITARHTVTVIREFFKFSFKFSMSSPHMNEMNLSQSSHSQTVRSSSLDLEANKNEVIRISIIFTLFDSLWFVFCIQFSLKICFYAYLLKIRKLAACLRSLQRIYTSCIVVEIWIMEAEYERLFYKLSFHISTIKSSVQVFLWFCNICNYKVASL